MNQSTAKIMIFLGIGLVILGLIFYLAGDKLNWIGNLPGDIKIEGENTKVYFPISTMILLSILMSVAMWLYKILK